jgi:hypothetical protein
VLAGRAVAAVVIRARAAPSVGSTTYTAPAELAEPDATRNLGPSVPILTRMAFDLRGLDSCMTRIVAALSMRSESAGLNCLSREISRSALSAMCSNGTYASPDLRPREPTGHDTLVSSTVASFDGCGPRSGGVTWRCTRRGFLYHPGVMLSICNTVSR